MKNYKDLLSELPSKSVVFTFGRFNPPSVGHELLVKVVRKVAKQRKADHIVFVSSTQDKKNPLEISKKIQYLELLFPNTKFLPCTDLADATKKMKARYKSVIAVTSSKNVGAYKKYFDDVVSSGSEDPDTCEKQIKAATKGNYSNFKKGLPTTARDLDGKRLMNDIRLGLGLEVIKEQINLVKDKLREQYFRGEIFNEGDIVESGDSVYRIIKRGSNHLLLQDETGKKVSKWVQDVQLTEREFMLDEKLLNEADAATASGISNKALVKAQADTEKARLVAQQADEKSKLVISQKKEMDNLKNTLKKEEAEDGAYKVNKTLMSLHDFRKTMKMGQKGVKVDNDKETESDIDASASATKAPDQSQVGGQQMSSSNAHDENIRRMKINYHLGEETKEQQGTREEQMKRFKAQASQAKLDPVEEEVYKGLEKEDKPGKKSTEFKGTRNSVTGKTVEGWKDEQKPVKEEFDDINEEELIAQVEADLAALTEEDFYEAYDDDELAIIDDETGEEIAAVAEEVMLDDEVLLEILSRHERIKARARMRRSQTKRVRREKVALRQLSTPQVANKRARRMAISALKKRLLKGRNPQKVSVGEKERVERFIAQRKKVVDRLSTRMVSRVKQVERARMSHKKFTRPNNGVAF